MAKHKIAQAAAEPWDDSPSGDEPAPEAPAVRKMPVRIETVEMADDYAGWTFTLNKNYTLAELESLCSGYYFRLRDTLKALATGWDFVDRDGQAIPFDESGWAALGVDLIGAMAAAAVRQTRLPNG